VISEVASVQVIDLHTHLLPPSHGPLCLWGIDELLTYVSFSKQKRRRDSLAANPGGTHAARSFLYFA
jgi:hypothetical protein